MSVLRRPRLRLLVRLALVGMLVLVPLAFRSPIARANSSVLLNEIEVNPPGNDTRYEYVELKGTPSSIISNGLYFVSVEGDASANSGAAGVARLVVDLSGKALGSNGLLVIASATSGHVFPPQTTLVSDPQFDSNNAALENDSNAFLLISSPSTPIVEGKDYDSAPDSTPDDGVLELPTGATIQDAIGWSDGGANDFVYAGVVLTQLSGVPDAATRFRSSTVANDSASWYNSNLLGTAQTGLDYDPATASSNFPANGALTPGDVNGPASNGAIVPACPSGVTTASGTSITATLSASDDNGTVTTAQITSAAVAGIAITNLTPASGPTGTASATLSVDATTAIGVYRVVITFANSDQPPQTASCAIFVSVTNPQGVRIHDIQGARHTSPLSSTLVLGVPGIVTAKRANGFYMQERDATADSDPATSEGIFVLTNIPPSVNEGDSVLVNGTVKEIRPGSNSANSLSVTTIDNPQRSVTKQSGGNALPAATLIGLGGRIPPQRVIDDDVNGDVEASGTFDAANDGIDFFESLEGMLVQINDAEVVGPTTSGGEIPVVARSAVDAVRTPRGGILVTSTDLNPERFILDNEIARSAPPANVGDRFATTVTGVIDYSANAFKLAVKSWPDIASGNLVRESVSRAPLGQVSIASLNMNGLASTSSITTFNQFASLVVTNLGSPDIIAVQEVADNNGTSDDGTVDASGTFKRLIEAIGAAGGPTYAYRSVDPVNNQDGGTRGANIRQGFLFISGGGLTFVDRPGATATSATSVAKGATGVELSASPGRIDPSNSVFNASRKPLVGEFVYRKQKLFVINEEFITKSGDQPLFGRFQPPRASTEAQRVGQARVISSFAKSILALDANANIAVVGAVNDYEFSTALDTLKGGVLTNLVDRDTLVPPVERYSAVDNGNSVAFDHMLLSSSLATKALTTFDIVHVQAEFADQITDRDPELARLALLRPGESTFEVFVPVIVK